MTIKSRSIGATPRSRIPFYRLVAVVLWLMSAWTTYLLLQRLMPTASWYTCAIAAGVTQLFLTVLESPAWHGSATPVNIVAVAVDTLINAGGLYPYTTRIGETPPAQMFIQAFQMDGAFSPIVAVAAAFLIGYVLAAGPETIWRWE